LSIPGPRVDSFLPIKKAFFKIDAFLHLLTMVAELARLAKNLQRLTPEFLRFKRLLQIKRLAELRLVAFVHDIPERPGVWLVN
jgi:hypothetical protein